MADFLASGNHGQEWQHAHLDLRRWAHRDIQLRFEAVRGSDYRSDIALDGISRLGCGSTHTGSGVRLVMLIWLLILV